ncbi:hypothetical protein VB713_12425 [Anabaena cylindrica UHCC 0172]|uniref:hypothetical protein n=1 Tax=Anabaena cylindrica TaxID=1165 RepID=UPI002B206B21|nr:hypothetical protein [Anabaena cylindrica]MEA5551778.1 hypothetical protein [Anabaena cylindrica UHCC 0172]
MKLNPVHDSTLLTQAKVYQIEGILYHYLYKDGTINHPQYCFRPLAGQRKTADIKLNRNKLLTRVQEVEGMNAKASVVLGNHLQMSLF